MNYKIICYILCFYKTSLKFKIQTLTLLKSLFCKWPRFFAVFLCIFPCNNSIKENVKKWPTEYINYKKFTIINHPMLKIQINLLPKKCVGIRSSYMYNVQKTHIIVKLLHSSFCLESKNCYRFYFKIEVYTLIEHLTIVIKITI